MLSVAVNTSLRGQRLPMAESMAPNAVITETMITAATSANGSSAGNRRVTAPTVLDISAPLRAIGRGSAVVVTVTFAPASRKFVAATAEDGRVREVFRGPSLTLACSAANQALEDLAPLPGAVRAPKAVHYRRTRPAYEQDVHFAAAHRRLVSWPAHRRRRAPLTPPSGRPISLPRKQAPELSTF